MKPQLLNVLSNVWNRPKATKNATLWWAILTLCVFSRILTTIYYIEDVDSLRFALSIKNYDLTIYQPHFPAYPVYCFIVKIFYFITGGKLAVSFSIAGGLSIFGVIYFMVGIIRLLFPALSNLAHTWVATLLFLNPLLWLMSNRYMPDLMGLAMLLACVYLFMKVWSSRGATTPAETGTANNHYTRYYLWGFYVVMGLLIGVRLSYLPFLLIPTLWLTYHFRQHFFASLGFGLLGILVWFVPLVIDTGGWDTLVQVAQKHLDGHFNEWGGTVKTESGYWLRVIRIFQYTWADGLGGYWLDRHWVTIIFSLVLYTGFYSYKRVTRNKKSADTGTAPPPALTAYEKNLITMRIILNLSLFVYLLWIFFFQNVLYKSRHIMPFIPFVLMRVAIGATLLKDQETRTGFAVMLLPLYIFITITLVNQHQRSTAIAQVKDYLAEHNQPQHIFYAPELVAFYLKRQHDWKLKFIYADKPNSLQQLQKARQQNPQSKVYSLVDLSTSLKKTTKQVKTFYHNPYVNRMWSELRVYGYE